MNHDYPGYLLDASQSDYFEIWFHLYSYDTFENVIFRISIRTCLPIIRAETNIRNVTNEPFSKRTNVRIFVRFDA